MIEHYVYSLTKENEQLKEENKRLKERLKLIEEATRERPSDRMNWKHGLEDEHSSWEEDDE